MKRFILGLVLAVASGIALAGPVNINAADAKTLAKELDGVGEAKAAAIVKYRTEKGPFTAPEQIKKVDGIGDAIFNANKANIKIKD